MNKKIKLSILFSVIAGLTCLSSLSFSGDDFEGGDYHHWQKRLIESKDSKNVVLLEMLGEVAKETDGLTSRILQIHGPHLFYGDNPNNKRDFQRLLLNIFKTNDLPKLKSFYGIKDGESDLLIARVFQAVFYLYAVETGFTYRIRENLKEALSWDWNDTTAPRFLADLIKSMDELLGPKISYHIRGRVITIQRVVGIEEVAVVIEWELGEVENSYNPKSDRLETTENVVEKRVVREFLAKAEAQKIEGDYGTTKGLPIDREAAVTLFKSLLKTTRIFENPSPREIGSSNWERLMPMLPGGMAFISIPAGTFEMGSVNGESDEKSLHRVTLTEFWMMTTEVTQKQWMDVMGSNPSNFKGDDLPVENVTWNDAQAFISKLNERNDGWTYRLPTEAEWEYAAIGLKPEEWDKLIREKKSAPAYSFGDNEALLSEHGWFSENSQGTIHPVASCPTKEKAKPNGFGLYDMHGNVWEWVSDWYGAYPSGSVIDPTGPSSGDYRVFRGGSWNGSAQNLRSAYRSLRAPGDRSSDVGLRLVRTK